MLQFRADAEASAAEAQVSNPKAMSCLPEDLDSSSKPAKPGKAAAPKRGAADANPPPRPLKIAGGKNEDPDKKKKKQMKEEEENPEEEEEVPRKKTKQAAAKPENKMDVETSEKKKKKQQEPPMEAEAEDPKPKKKRKEPVQPQEDATTEEDGATARSTGKHIKETKLAIAEGEDAEASNPCKKKKKPAKVSEVEESTFPATVPDENLPEDDGLDKKAKKTKKEKKDKDDKSITREEKKKAKEQACKDSEILALVGEIEEALAEDPSTPRHRITSKRRSRESKPAPENPEEGSCKPDTNNEGPKPKKLATLALADMPVPATKSSSMKAFVETSQDRQPDPMDSQWCLARIM